MEQINSKSLVGGGKVAVALSGGVDSGVAAALLVKEGYQVVGFHLHFWAETQTVGNVKNKNLDYRQEPSSFSRWRSLENKCCSTESLEAARKTAALLKIPFYTLNFEDIFKEKVVDYFLREFGRGRTPNPCVMCNKYIKFGHFLNYVQKLGYDFLATGHYARVVSSGVDRALLQSIDPKKDQSYFLYNLTQEQLAHILFPVGDYNKNEVRTMAKKWKLPVAERPESQEICFFPETDYRLFLKRNIGAKIKPGKVIDVEDRVIGEHDGLPLYTIGQRHGFRISHKFNPPAGGQSYNSILPLYVVGMDIKKNQLIVGWGKECERSKLQVGDVNWINPSLISDGILQAQVRIRHQGELYPCQLIIEHQLDKPIRRSITSNLSLITVSLDEPVRAITPGQSAVFYNKEKVLGGGIIVKVT